MGPRIGKLLDPSTLQSLAEDLPTACAQARENPEQFAQIFGFLVRVARVDLRSLDDAGFEWLAERASEADVPPALRRDLAKAYPQLESRRYLSTLVKDAEQDEESRDYLRWRTEAKKPPEHLMEELLRSEVSAVRELGARTAIRLGVLLTVAAGVLIHDAKEEILGGLASAAGSDSPLREAIALVAVCRSTLATAASTIARLEAVRRSPCWLRGDPRVDPVLRVDGKWPGCDDLTRMPGSHELLTKTLNILFEAKRPDLAVPILLDDMHETTIADLLRDEVKGWQSSPELVALLVQNRPDIDPGIVADLCGLFLPVPAQPRNHVSDRSYPPWERLREQDDTPARMLPAFVSGLLDPVPRAADEFDGIYWRVPSRRLDALIERFRASPAGTVAGKLAMLKDREAARAAFLAWFGSYASPTDWDGIFGDVAAPARVERLNRLRKRLVEALAKMPADEARSILRRAPGALAEKVAASINTPRALRLAAVFVALAAPDFDSKRCDISDDVELISDAFVELRRAPSPRMEAAQKYLLGVALNAIVRDPPCLEDFDEQSMPHFRLRDALRETLNSSPEAARFAADHLATALSRSLRRFLSDGLPTQHNAHAVAWLRAIPKLRDPRPATVLEQNVRSLASAGLGEIADEALRDTRMTDDLSDASRVVLAIRKLRRD